MRTGSAARGPILAVLPFRAADDRVALLAQGRLEDVCGELARFPELQVISWRSGLAVADLPDREAGTRLGATHLLRGRLEEHGGWLRVTATLVDCAAGTQLWHERFEAPAADVFTLQDEVVARIAATFTARLEESALHDARRKPTESLAAYEATLRGLALLRQGTVAADEEARRLFEQALERDPTYARAQAGLSLSWFNEWSCQHWSCFEENGRRAYEHAHRALDLDDRDPLLHLVLGRLLLYRREHEQASWYLDRALALCPNDARLLIELSVCEAYLGRPEIGIERAAKAMRLNPYHSNDYYAYAALPHLMARRFDRAVALIGKATGVPIVDNPANAAVALAHVGRIEEAQRQLARYIEAFRERITYGREPEPGEAVRWLLDTNPYRREEDRELIREGFRMLGQAHASAPSTDAPGTGLLAPQGETWVAVYAGRRALLPDLVGLHDIRRLLARPGEQLHCLDLAGRGDDADQGEAVLDAEARQKLKARIRELQETIAEAEAMNDLGRAGRARGEMEALVEALSKALGLGGRSRRLGNLTERARSTVTARIRHAIRKVEGLHEPLARHLDNSIRTGTFCCYRPERPVSWRTSDVVS